MASGTGSWTVDFGATPVEIATATVTGQTGIASGDHVECYFHGDDSTADNPADTHKWILPKFVSAVPDAIVADTGFTISLLSDFPLTGEVVVRYVWTTAA